MNSGEKLKATADYAGAILVFITMAVVIWRCVLAYQATEYGSYGGLYDGAAAAPAIIGYIIIGGLSFYLCYVIKVAITAFGDLVANSFKQSEYLKVENKNIDGEAWSEPNSSQPL
ncbi:MAG: hypothetical protein LBO63_01285 [Oscillospiraceae bacterium]|jgi:hypothetical protein|nr:hypothetical protein [Oscillospiraceae bacterium]